MSEQTLSKIQLFLGLALAIAAAVLFFAGAWTLTARIVLGLCGIALVISSKFGIMR